MRKAKAASSGGAWGGKLAEGGVEELLVRVIHESGLRDCCWW
jgi:hypothetical protein